MDEDYIDRSDCREHFANSIRVILRDDDTNERAEEILVEFDSLPSIKARKVITCGECKHYYSFPDEYRTCHEFYECDGTTKIMEEYDFCSHGELRSSCSDGNNLNR